jgi:hypothetical protein
MLRRILALLSRQVIYVHSRPVIALTFIGLGTAISAVVFLWLHYSNVRDLQVQLEHQYKETREVYDAAERRVEGLQGNSVMLQEAVEIIERVGISDNDIILQQIQEATRARQYFQSELAEFAERLDRIKARRKYYIISSLDSAIGDAAKLRTEIQKEDKEITGLGEVTQELRENLSNVLREETEILTEELRAFYRNLSFLIAQFEGAARQQPTAEFAGIEEQAHNLAELSYLVYKPQSLVAKRLSLKEPRPTALAEWLRRIGQPASRDQKVILEANLQGWPSPPGTVPFLTIRNRWLVKTGGLNLRQGPSTEAKVVCVLHRYDPVRVLNNGSYWWRVKTRCGTGYVGSSYLTR